MQGGHVLRVSKFWISSIRIGFALVAVVLAGSFTHVQAALMCTSANTIVLNNGIGMVSNAALAGMCVQSTDKLYGNFSLAELPAGIVEFNVNAAADSHSITFAAPFANQMYSFSYEVATLGVNDFITQLIADVVQTQGVSVLGRVPSVTPSSGGLGGSISLTKVGSFLLTPPGNAVLNWNVGLASDIILTNTLNLFNASDDSAVLNTFMEATPEPATLELLGIALI